MIHLSAIHDPDRFRADVMAQRGRVARLTEQLRDEIEQRKPSLHWPFKRKTTGGHDG